MKILKQMINISCNVENNGAGRRERKQVRGRMMSEGRWETGKISSSYNKSGISLINALDMYKKSPKLYKIF